MKKYYGILCLLVLSVLSCSKYDDSEIWDYVKEMNQRLTALEEKCREMNTNISALQTIVGAIETGDYITNVAPVTKEGKTIGYTISFLKSPAITIFNGTDGKEGYSPVVSVQKDEDDLYYWTIDGEWLLDADGNKVRASGIDGLNGTNGTNGDNGITPQLKIENEYWYVSYDSGETWQMLGKATGDKGADGQSIFSSVEVGENEVTFVLADGTSFSIPLKNATVEDVHEWVDLGLPSGTLWATCNVGADTPEEYGYYFAWGETKSKDDYSWDNYWFGGGKIKIGSSTYTESVTKYCFNYGYNNFTDNLAELEPVNDVAIVYWGEEWQMPSKEQCDELVNDSYTKTEMRAHNNSLCLKITSTSNGNFIFLPAAGSRRGMDLETTYNMYWSRSLDTSESNRAYIMEFSSGSDYFATFYISRSIGMPVRPVRKQ